MKLKSSSRLFNTVDIAHPGRSGFNLSYSKLFDCDMGQLIPVACDEVTPGDYFRLGCEMVVRFNPLVAPILHQIDAKVWSYFIPYRLLWDKWEDFITGGKTGLNADVLPRWDPGADYAESGIHSLWDYLGFPTGVRPNSLFPMTFPRDAYNLIWNEYYRDETLQDPVDLDNPDILNVCWDKDYGTSALLTQQRGVAPALPISGVTYADFGDADLYTSIFHRSDKSNPLKAAKLTPATQVEVHSDNSGTLGENYLDVLLSHVDLNNNTVDLSNATTFNVADLRLVVAIQRWLERSARGGYRYIEHLMVHHGVSPRDERLQRPELIGMTKFPVIISEVLQTSKSETGAPQGNMSGHAITVGQGKLGSYHFKEHGLMMTVMAVVPKPAYCQGINRQWLRFNRFEFYDPLFAHLSEQAIYQGEINAEDVAEHNLGVFGYQGHWDEMRYKPNQVCGLMRQTTNGLAHWHMGRIFETPPALNEDFVKCLPTKRVFAVQNQPGLIVHFNNLIDALRPLPIQSIPGLMDH